MKVLRKFLLILLTSLMMLQVSQIRLIAEEEADPSTSDDQQYNVMGDKTAAPYELTDESESTRTTKVTLSLLVHGHCRRDADIS